MPTFEVTIETPFDGDGDDGGTTLTLVVDAEHWVGAWREGLRVMGVKTPPPNAVCEVGQDESVRIGLPDSPGRWLVRPRPEPSATRAAPAGEGAPRVPPNQVEPLSSRVIPPAGGPSPATTALPRKPPLAPQPAGTAAVERDPRARPLATGDRARLGKVARRLALREDGEPATRGGRFRAEATNQGRPTPPSGLVAPPPSELTAGFSAMERDVTLLPQQFRAIAAPVAGRAVPGGSPQQAVENAWQHIPCQLAQTLRYRDGDALEVVAARGERERETLRCHIDAGGVFEHLLSPRPARVKFTEDKTRLRYVDGRGDAALELPVRSAVCVPITVAGRRWGVLLLLNSTRASGFAEGELRAVSYLATTLGRALTVSGP